MKFDIERYVAERKDEAFFTEAACKSHISSSFDVDRQEMLKRQHSPVLLNVFETFTTRTWHQVEQNVDTKVFLKIKYLVYFLKLQWALMG